VTARSIYRRNKRHLDHGRAHVDFKDRRDGSQNSKHTLQQSRSLKWRIQQYRPVQVTLPW